jgi:hypothetical protein
MLWLDSTVESVALAGPSEIELAGSAFRPEYATVMDPPEANVPPSDPDVLIVAPVRGCSFGSRIRGVLRWAAPGAGEPSSVELHPTGTATVLKSNHNHAP